MLDPSKGAPIAQGSGIYPAGCSSRMLTAIELLLLGLRDPAALPSPVFKPVIDLRDVPILSANVVDGLRCC